MRLSSPTLYSRLRTTSGGSRALREGRNTPPETLLQAIWQHQRLRRNTLRTACGRPLFILHPGFLNREAGPDFREALVQIGDSPAQTGDIEVDPHPSDWIQHKHDRNAAYRNVLLHVVWRTPTPEPDLSGLPTLELEPALDAPLSELGEWLSREDAVDIPEAWRGNCAAPLEHLSSQQLYALLEQASLFRMRARAEQFRVRARNAGWTQAFWEGTFRALGYKHNPWPMQRLAELRARWDTPGASRTELQARLLGLSGLLPSDIRATRAAASPFARQLWDCWWRERDALSDCALPSRAWRRAGIRPANHPHRRLALAAHWIHQGDLPERLQRWAADPHADSKLGESLLTLLRPDDDPYWSRHYTLHSRGTSRAIPLLGKDRVTDLAANVILPWLWSRADQGRRTRLCAEIEHRYLVWTSGSDNATLKRARERLLGGRTGRLPSRMALQQGLLQIVRDYCDQSNSRCERCRFPDVAHQFGAP